MKCCKTFAKSLEFYRYNIEICIYRPKQKKNFCYLGTLNPKDFITLETVWIETKNRNPWFNPGVLVYTKKYVSKLKTKFSKF